MSMKSDVMLHSMEEDSAASSYNNLSLEEKLEQDWKLAFTNPITEARYVEYTFTPASLWFPAVATTFLGIILLALNVLDFQADLVNNSFSTFFFTNASWQREGTETVRILNYVSGGTYLVVGTLEILYALLSRNKGTDVPGWVLELLWLVGSTTVLVNQYSADWRYLEWCRPNEFSVVMRHKDVEEECTNVLDAYTVLAPCLSFVLPVRIRYWIPTLLILMPYNLPFRHAVLNVPFMEMRTSDAVWISTTLILLVAVFAIENLKRKQYKQSAAVEHEGLEVQRAKKALDTLLVSMLPPSVLQRIVRGETISDSAVVTSLFSDIAGFTSWCSMRKAKDVVSMVNAMYTLFDKGLKRYEIEKIKTIGDAYWAVCGLPDANREHALHVCAFSKFMHRCMQRMGEQNAQHAVSIRIGVHTGLLSGGLVGTQQSTYDVFGNASDAAQTMEQNAPVGGVLVSEKTFFELRRHGVLRSDVDGCQPGDVVESVGVCRVTQKHESLPTAEGPLATFVLDEMLWLPPRLRHSLHNCSVFENGEDILEAMAELGNTATVNELYATKRIPAELAELPRDSHPVSAVEDRPSKEVDDKAASPSSDDDDASSPNADVSTPKAAPAPPAMSLDEYAAMISKASGKIAFTFDDEQIERECTEFIWKQFPSKLRVMAVMMSLFIFALYTIQLATTSGNTAAMHVLIVLNLCFQVAQFLLAPRLHPFVGMAAYYAGCQIVLVSLVLGEDSVVTNDLLYVSFVYLMFSSVIGFVGGYPYLLQCGLNVLFLFVPQLIIQVRFKALYIHYVIGPSCMIVMWVVGLRNSEKSLRKLFVDSKMQDFALQRTVEEHGRVSELLGRMVPKFIVEDLTVWFCGPRTMQLAVTFPFVGILFFRVPGFSVQFQTLSPAGIMTRISEYVSVCDRVMEAYSESCTKLKLVGDIVVAASGLHGHSEIATREAAAATQKDERRAARLQRLKEATHTTVSVSIENINNLVGDHEIASGSKTPIRVSVDQSSDRSTEDMTLKIATPSTPNEGGSSYLLSPTGRGKQHVHQLALLATRMASAVENELDVKVSAGMHCGPVTGGIIGTDRLIYDVFGDTVNTASRVMSTSGEGLWASKHLSGALPMWPGIAFGDEVPRQMKGKGTLHVVSVRQLPCALDAMDDAVLC